MDVKSIISQMTLEEKAALCSGKDFWHLDTSQSLGIESVMVSDGVTASGTEWLCDLIANYEDDDPQALSERIVERAVKDRADGHEDDVSAVVLLIE